MADSPAAPAARCINCRRGSFIVNFPSHHSITWSAREQRRWDFEAEGFGGLEVDHKLEFSRLYHGQVRRLYALEYPPGVDALLANCIGNTGPVTDQTTNLGIVTHRIYRGNQVARREDRNLNAPAVEERVRGDEQGVSPLVHKGREGGINLVAIARVENLDLQPDFGGSRLHILHGPFGALNIARIYQH